MHIDKKALSMTYGLRSKQPGTTFSVTMITVKKIKTCSSKSADENRADKSLSVVHRVGGVYILVSDREL